MSNLRGYSDSKRSFNRSIDSFNITKPRLTTKWKDRLNNTQLLNQNPKSSRQKNHQHNQQTLNASFYQSNSNTKPLLGNTRRIQPYCILDQQGFANTSSKLQSINFEHHNPELCVCKDCTCGRHLCKLHIVGPNMTKNSIYQKSYIPQNYIPNIVNISGEYPKNNGPHLEMNSTQRKDFKGNKGDETERPHPQDLLKTGGPCPQLTSYTSGFPGHYGNNQYVKPTDKHVRGDMPLQARTTYNSTFGRSGGRPASMEKNPDNFKHGQPWLGKTTYGSFFQTPNTDDYSKKVKITQKLQIDPHYKHQYESIYKNDFQPLEPTQCKAKIELESKIKGMMSSKKQRFLENSDFKSLSPDFHALSLSKHKFA